MVETGNDFCSISTERPSFISTFGSKKNKLDSAAVASVFNGDEKNGRMRRTDAVVVEDLGRKRFQGENLVAGTGRSIRGSRSEIECRARTYLTKGVLRHPFTRHGT